MQKFENFYFEDYSFDERNLIAKFEYSFDKNVYFTEEIDFSSDFDLREDFDIRLINNYLFPLFLALGISYYKLCPTRDLIIEKYSLYEIDKTFWRKFYINGLGEFFYKNSLDPSNYCNFITTGKIIFMRKNFKSSDKILLPIGGGKDSLVTADILEKNNLDYTPFVFGKLDDIKKSCLEIMGKKILHITRKMDEKLFEFNKQGYYNGHVPITGILSLVALNASYLYDFGNVILSNEKSANYGNTEIKSGENFYKINHQYSKSYEFEKDLNGLIFRSLSGEMKYFSLIRPMYEIKIAKYFAENCKKYFEVFSSCNANFKINSDNTAKKWCSNCPKCAFVYAILRPFLTDKETLQIFGKELYEDENLEKLFKKLTGIEGIKPFECVGEKEEIIFSMYKVLQNFKLENKKIPIILQMFEKEILGKFDFENLESKLFANYFDETNIPEKFLDIYKKLD